MFNPKTRDAANAAGVSLLVFCASVACLIPPLNERFIDSALHVVAIGLAIAVSAILHLVFVGFLARSMGKSPGKYVVLALATFPVGSIVALVLMEWSNKFGAQEKSQGAA